MITPFKRILFLALVLSCHSLTQAQEARGGRTVSNTTAENTGKTYAIIMGVSEYQHPQTYPNLSYADDDARAFYHFLKSPEGGRVPDAQIDTLINQNVTIARFNEALANVRTVLKAGDMFYIYFAGHGDALAHDLAFLLPYDAPAGKGKEKEKNHYYNGEHLLINVLTLKSKLRQIAEQEGVRVVLITDACRTDELPGGRAGRQYAYDVIFEKNMGQIQLISCSSNESSLESEDWGNGRGLFSYHLINGLYGMADNQPRDGKVTLSELYDYTKDSVKAYSGYRQNPRYCCGEHDYMVLSRAPSGNFTYRPGNSASPSNNPTLLAGRGIDLGAH